MDCYFNHFSPVSIFLNMWSISSACVACTTATSKDFSQQFQVDRNMIADSYKRISPGTHS